MSLHSTGVRCSAFDETLVIPLDGTSKSSLLVSPAFDPDSSDETPLPDDQRNDYFALQYIPFTPAGSYQVTDLPRDRMQRWHDQNCRNVAIDAGFPVFGAGPGSDRLVDINQDGFVDVLRFELATGDGPENLDNIRDGLLPSWGYRDSCGEFPAHQDAGVRVYLNRGDGSFEPQADFLFELDGIPHASYRINWLGGDLIDINADTRTDFILPIDTNLADDKSTFTLFYSRPSGDLANASVNTLGAWSRYDSDNTWKENLHRLGGIRMVRRDDTGTFLVLGDRKPSDPGVEIEASRWVRKTQWPRITGIEDGLGAKHAFQYGPYTQSTEQVQLPAARMTAPKTVVSSHSESVGPDGQTRKTCYAFTGPVRDLRSGRFLGFEQSTASVTYGADCSVGAQPDARTRRVYDFAYDPVVEDYPHASQPTVAQSEVWVENGAATVERRISCDLVDGWEVRTPEAGATWFSYPSARHSFVHVAPSEDRTCEQLANPGDGASVSRLSEVHETQSRNDQGALVAAVKDVDAMSTTTTTYSRWLDDEPGVDVDAHWFRGKAQRVEVTSCGSGVWGNLAECDTRVEEFVYDAPHAEIDSMVLQPGDPKLELTTSYARDERGRMRVKYRMDAAENVRADRSAWDVEGVHLEWTSNALGQVSYAIHDHATGVLVSQVEPNGNAVETVYDGFLRPVRVQRRETPIGAFSPVWQELGYFGPSGADAFALQTVTITKPEGQVKFVELDAHGKKLREQWEGVVDLDDAQFEAPDHAPLNHSQVEVFYEYDERGRNNRESKPTWVGTAPPSWREWTFDDLDRKRSSVLLDQAKNPMHEAEHWDFDYSADPWKEVIETHTDEDAKQTVRHFDSAGRVSAAFDGMGTPTRFMHGAFGRVREVYRGGLDAGSSQSTTTYTYDALGRRSSETAPENGTSSIEYTPFGEVEVVTQPEGLTAFAYDDLGRVTHRFDDDGTAQWTYDTERTGALSSSTSADGISRAYTYDLWGRVESATTSAALGDFTLAYAYDDFDRLTQVTYPEPGYTVFHEYDVFGYHRRSRSQRAPCSLAESAIDWEWVEADPAGNVTLERMGNGAETTRLYQAGTYRPELLVTNPDSVAALPQAALQNLEYTWSDGGDLQMRTDYKAGQTEDFTYDDAHRLLTWSWGGTTFETQYDVLGNISSKSGQGTYVYNSATDRLDAVGARAYTYDDNGNVLSDGERTLTWTSQNKVRSLNRGGEAWSLLYDADGARVVREVAAANTSTYNLAPTYELRFDGARLTEARISVLGSTGRVVAEVFAERTELAANDRWEHRKKFVHDDHLGSTHTVTDRDGAVESRVMYGPWGQARNGDNWDLSLDEAALDQLPTGFTGHQPELDAGLINMRGRMYDPAVGRFMSVDPVIENALEVGTWNAYSYVQNRPLSLVDPTGMAAEEPVDDPEGEVAAYDGADLQASIFFLFLEWLSNIPSPTPQPDDAPQPEEFRDGEGERVEDETKGWKYWAAVQGLGIAWAFVDSALTPLGLEAEGEGPEVEEARDSWGYTVVMLGGVLLPVGAKIKAKVAPRPKAPRPTTGGRSGCGDDAETVGPGEQSGAQGAQKAGRLPDAAVKHLSPQMRRSVRSWENRLAEHRNKLDAYRRNPDAFDNKGFLKNAPTPEIRQQIIDSRVRHLETEIRNFEKQIADALGGG